MNITLNQIISLVGKLDDNTGETAARERFREFLKTNIESVGQVRDYIHECLANSGDQYSRAFQDLVNYLGHFLGFQVIFGRYAGIRGALGYDGLWVSPRDFHIVIEVKTTQVYAIKTSTLESYINGLIDDKKIPDRMHALGLYVVGRTDPDIKQLENNIVAEQRTNALRVISVDSLISLAELSTEYDVTHDDILAVLKPAKPSADQIIDLMARLVAQQKSEQVQEQPSRLIQEQPGEYSVETSDLPTDTTYWLTPVNSDEEISAEEAITNLVGEEKIYAIGERTPGRKFIKPGDQICFYATTRGVVAYAQVLTSPVKERHPAVGDPDQYSWVFKLINPKLFIDKPIAIDASLRSKLDEFKNRDPQKGWAWFVQATRRLDKHDFLVLTGQTSE